MIDGVIMIEVIPPKGCRSSWVITRSKIGIVECLLATWGSLSLAELVRLAWAGESAGLRSLRNRRRELHDVITAELRREAPKIRKIERGVYALAV